MWEMLTLLPRFLGLIGRNVRRSAVRSLLTVFGTMALVLVVVLVWSVLTFLDNATREKSQNFKAVVTERWQIPSQMPFAYAASLTQAAAREPSDVRPADSMTWQFFGGTLDKGKRTRDNSLFAFALEPRKLLTMMDELDSLPAGKRAEFEPVVEKLARNRQGLIVGQDRLAAINKRVGERITLYGINYREIDLEFEIVGLFPEGRYNNSAAFDRDYLNAALDRYSQERNGQKHALAEKSLNLVWLRVPDSEAFQQVARQILASPEFTTPAVKCETASSGVSTFIEAYRDLLWGMRWLLAPACLVSLSLVISNAISIGVRERRLELAVLKVLGYRPSQILFLVLGEALLLGAVSGLVCSSATYYYVNEIRGGLKFPIAFFPAFLIPTAAFWWGPALGGTAAGLGALLPAWAACRVKVTDVFSRVA